MNRFAISVLTAMAGCAGLASDIPPPRPVDVAALVRQLGSEDFAEREAASRRLSTLSVDAPPPELLEALKSPNPEIQNRARRAVFALKEHIVRERERIILSRLPREERFAKRGEIDLYIASTAANELKSNDDRLWLPAFELGVTTAAKAGLKGGYRPQGGPAWVKHFPTYRANILNNRMIRTDGVFTRRERDFFILYGAVLAAGVDEPHSVKGLIVSRGTVRVRKSIDNSLVLATGDIVAEGMLGSAIICDGDLRVKGMIGCFVVTRGDVEVDGYGYENTVISGGKVSFKKPVPLPNQQTLPKEMENRIQERVVRPLDFVTFFELSTVGVEVKAEDKAVQVTAVADGKPFADAGVRVGDTITEVNGKKPDSAESLRRLLRDALAVGDATVKLQRGGKTETVKVSLPE